MRWCAMLVLSLALAGSAASGSLAQSPLIPLEVVNRFCQADGRGDRVHPRQWGVIAPLVTWTLEPAWDHIALISGYQVKPPRVVDDHIEIDVEYTVVGAVSSEGEENREGLETVPFSLVGDDVSGWRIDGPPPPPYLFANLVNVDTMRATLAPDSTSYVSASAFVWRMLREAGWPVPYRPVSQLRDPEVFAAVEQPKAGDLALFLGDGAPYHVGIVTGDGQIASATINAGLMRTPANAFAGTVLYLRLREPLTPRATPEGSSPPETAASPPVSPTPEAAPPPSPAPFPEEPATPAKNSSRRHRSKQRRPRHAVARKAATPTATPHHLAR